VRALRGVGASEQNGAELRTPQFAQRQLLEVERAALSARRKLLDEQEAALLSRAAQIDKAGGRRRRSSTSKTTPPAAAAVSTPTTFSWLESPCPEQPEL